MRASKIRPKTPTFLSLLIALHLPRQDVAVAEEVVKAAARGRPTVITVKHSGSLLTLSYDGGWAAKNSVANEFTAGESVDGSGLIPRPAFHCSRTGCKFSTRVCRDVGESLNLEGVLDVLPVVSCHEPVTRRPSRTVPCSHQGPARPVRPIRPTKGSSSPLPV